jgi:hypothetical protein
MSKWVTWQNVGIDRMGCAWLIRRFIDKNPEFIFIPEGSTALPKGAEPFDIPGVRLSHHGGHCSFHAFLREYKLDDPVLRRIARIIDEADTVQEANVEPSSPGLDLICTGIRLNSDDDHVAVERGATIYDALRAALNSEQERT